MASCMATKRTDYLLALGPQVTGRSRQVSVKRHRAVAEISVDLQLDCPGCMLLDSLIEPYSPPHFVHDLRKGDHEYAVPVTTYLPTSMLLGYLP